MLPITMNDDEGDLGSVQKIALDVHLSQMSESSLGVSVSFLRPRGVALRLHFLDQGDWQNLYSQPKVRGIDVIQRVRM